MKHNPFDARCVFVDGPVAVFVHHAAGQDILDSYARIARYIAVAAEQLDTGASSDKTQEDNCLVQSWAGS